MSNFGRTEPRTVAELDAILDELIAPFVRSTDQHAGEGTGTTVKLSPGMVERTVAAALRMRDVGGRGGASGPRKWWRRPAAVIPIAFVLFGSFASIWIWDPRDSDTLSYENAHKVVFDPAHNEERRNVAVGKLTGPMLRGIIALRRAIEVHESLRTDGNAVLDAIETMLDKPLLARGGTWLADGSFEGFVRVLEDPTSSKEVLRNTLLRFLDASRPGLQVLHRATSEPGLVGEQARKRIPLLKRFLRMPLPPQQKKK